MQQTVAKRSEAAYSLQNELPLVVDQGQLAYNVKQHTGWNLNVRNYRLMKRTCLICGTVVEAAYGKTRKADRTKLPKSLYLVDEMFGERFWN